ncbi:BTAD domain-containing putative transcriptional regulator [Streptomyces sp. NBC_00102]|uniref:AfsR/SARP family transcriptional regulator n=1 Tax=Streptomyces sp. NBC_00102 TaxID=2975652 RepID=UPI0022599C17|nr:BTAD domain-containing putative transcriptional regulator [Streptomyces sp. NBC_00102]MCX5398683.1 AAA family ATPase [Streptomyces sp. NBC_00102]
MPVSDDGFPCTVRFSLLGPLTVTSGGQALALGPLKQRAVLAMLLCHPNNPVSVDCLADTVWPAEAPRTARKNLQKYVWALRRLLCEAGAPGRLDLAPGGYLLRVREEEADTLRFRALTAAGREAARAGRPDTAVELLRRALDLWQGTPLTELSDSEPLRSEADRLTDRYLSAYETWAELASARGRDTEVAEAVADVVEAHPLRERLRAVQMIALHRAGRQSEALAVYGTLRQLLARELGLAPSAAMEEAYRTVLAQTPGDSAPPAPAAPRRAPARTLLPPDTPDWTGRREQLAELRDAVRGGKGHVTVLVGPVGTGKSTLMVHLAHSLREDFPDGRLLVDLRRADGTDRRLADVLGELARAARLDRVTALLPDHPAQAAAVWRDWLAEHRVLLLLENATGEAAVRPLLPGTGDGAAVIASRSWLAGLAGAHRIVVEPLTVEEAMELLGRIVGPSRVHADPVSARRIVEACGLSPLAVRIGGQRLAVLRHLPLSEYAARLSEPEAVMDELSVGDLAVRNRMADGWRTLTDPGRSVLLRLGRLPLARPFTLGEAARALDCPEPAALRLLEQLIGTGALVSPSTEVTAHAALYELPRLAHLYLRELGGLSGRGEPTAAPWAVAPPAAAQLPAARSLVAPAVTDPVRAADMPAGNQWATGTGPAGVTLLTTPHDRAEGEDPWNWAS